MISTEIICELTSESDWIEAYPILKVLRRDLDQQIFLSTRENYLSNNLTLFGLRVDGELQALAGVALYPHLSRQIDCWVHDIVTNESSQSKGYGRKLMQHIEKWAEQKGCSRVSVHTRVERKDSQRFYQEKLGYSNNAIVYSKEL